MTQNRHHALIGKMRLLLQLSEQEKRILLDLCQDESTLRKGQALIAHEDSVTLLLGGWACRYKMFEDGRRQITSFILPGDFSSVRACLFGVMDFETEALTDCRVAKVSGNKLVNLFKQYPRLAAAVTWGAAREGAMMTERVVSLGRRSARERMAHLFLELQWRLESVGVVDRAGYPFPITQEILADCLGLSMVHVNRTLQSMRKDGLLDCRKGYITLQNVEELREICSFSSAHLQGRLHPGLCTEPKN